MINKPKIVLRTINLLMTNWCNLHCEFCDYVSSASERRELSFVEIIDIIDQGCSLGLERLDLSGGEPMTRKDVYDIISHASKKRIQVLMVTNGTLIDDRKALKLIESGLSAVAVSLEGFEKTNDSIRGKGSFKKAIDAIKSFVSYKDRLDYVKVAITVSAMNFRELYSFTKYLIETVGVSSVSYNPFDEEMLCKENVEAKKGAFLIEGEKIKELENEIESIIDYLDQKSIKSIPPNYLRKFFSYFGRKLPVPNRPCYEPFNGCAVDGTGMVFSCWGEKKPIGSVLKTSLKSIIESEEYARMCERASVLQCGGCLKSCYMNVHC